MDKSTGTSPSLEEKKALLNCGNKDGNIIHVLKKQIPPVATVFGGEFLAQGLHLKSHQRCSAGIMTWLSADWSSSSTLTES